MTGKEIVKAINAKPLAASVEERMEKDYQKAFASDLMSDVLAMVSEPENTVLITGLSNAQALRTAEMLDIDLIIFVRGKRPVDGSVDLAELRGVNVYSTGYTMYETCGILFREGLGGIYGSHSA
ncbi:MAG: hypothetical protein IKE37_02550 [Firmicutes bacterium]|nr:hypothetical protein [Bacillota bacterium]